MTDDLRAIVSAAVADTAAADDTATTRLLGALAPYDRRDRAIRRAADLLRTLGEVDFDARSDAATELLASHEALSDDEPELEPVLALPPEPGVGVTVEAIGGRQKGVRHTRAAYGNARWESASGGFRRSWVTVLELAGPAGVRVVPAEAGEHRG